MCTTGRRVFAQEALRTGLVNAVLPTEWFIEHALHWCGRITRNPTAAIYAAKRTVTQGLKLPLEEGLVLEREAFLDLNASEDAKLRNAAVTRPVQ